jgi:hypothetical protein
MTTSEARENLIAHGLSEQQAAGVVDVLERWEKDRVVTRDYLDLRLAQTELKLAELEKKLYRMEARIYGGIGTMLVVAVLVQHFWR